MGPRSLLLLLPLCSVLACAKPQPKAPEMVIAHEAQKRPTSMLNQLKLSERQRVQVDLLRDETRTELGDYEKARKILLREAILQVKEGVLDRSRMEPLAENAVSAFEKALPGLVRIVNRLHGTLSRSQRQHYVDLMQGEKKDMSPEEKRNARNEEIGRILDLTTGQKSKIYPALLGVLLSHWSVVQSTRGGIADAQEAFIEDEFDAAQLAIVKDVDLAAVGEVAFDALETTLPLLTEEQRQTFAAWMEATGG